MGLRCFSGALPGGLQPLQQRAVEDASKYVGALSKVWAQQNFGRGHQSCPGIYHALTF